MEEKYIELVVERGEQKFKFLVPEGSNIGISYDACFEILNHIVNMAQDAAQKMRPIEHIDPIDAVAE